jgi:capsular exopolysaccharide synthesis family protein
MAEIGQFLQIIKKWWWLIILSTLLATGVGFGASRLLTPVYSASTILLVKPRNVTDNTIFASEQLIDTYRELLTKRPVIAAAARALNLDPRETEQRVQARLVRSTALIELAAEANDPRLAMELANGVIIAFGEISRESGNITARDLVVVEPATLPTRPDSPRVWLILILATVLGFGLSTSLAFLMEYLDDTLATTKDIQRYLALPTLSLIPCLHRFGKCDKQLLIINESEARLSRPYHMLNTSLHFLSPTGPPTLLLITSPSSQETEARIVANLGVAIAQAGRKILLVDADLRQPQLHQILGVRQEPGLSQLLAEAEARPAYIVETHIPNLRLLPAGKAHLDPLVLMNSATLAQLMEKLREQADTVLFHSPPVLAAPETLMVAAQVEGTILVIKSRSTRRQLATQALTLLHNASANVCGVVLTGVRHKLPMDGYYPDLSQPEQTVKASYRSNNGLGEAVGAVYEPSSLAGKF